MNSKEHAEYLKKLKAASKKILATRESSAAFLVAAGIHTPSGRLSRVYYHPYSEK